MYSLLHEVDVAIAGAGPAGSALAIMLSKAGFDVLLVERSEFTVTRAGESLSPQIATLMKELGAWQAFQNLSPLPAFGVKSIWGADHLESVSHIKNVTGQGWQIDRASVDAMLADQARHCGAELICNAVVSEINYQSMRWDFRLHCKSSKDRPKRVRAKVLVDATGRNAKIANALGAKRILFDRLVGVCARYGREKTHSECHLLLETCEEGWWYSAPLNPSTMITTLMTDSDLCGATGYSAVKRWDQLISSTQEHARRLLKQGMFHRVDEPWVISAVSQRLNRNGDSRPWLAVGDAALSTDPLAGSGFVRALQAAEKAAACVSALLDSPSSDGITAYEKNLDNQCTKYLHERREYYAMEKRYPDSKFWARRDLTRRRVVGL